MVKPRLSYRQTVFALFLAATLLPLIVLSSVTIGLSSEMVDSILTQNVSSGVELTGRKLDAFTASAGRSLVAIAARPELPELLSGSNPAKRTEDTAAIAETVRRWFSPDEPPVNVYILAEAGGTWFSTTGTPAPVPLAFLEAIAENPAGITVSARKTEAASDRYASFRAGTAVIGPSGECEGYIIAEVPRETLKTVLAPLPQIAELTIFDGEGVVAFSMTAQETEGLPRKGAAGSTATRSGADLIAYEGIKFGILAEKPASLVASLVEKLTLISIICSCVCALFALTASVILSRRLSGPITRLISATKAVADGDLSVCLAPDARGELADLMSNFNVMVGDLKRLFDKTVEEQELLKQAELDSLSSQINPHFFFNALSSIDALAKLGSCAEISTVTKSLGKLLRGSISGKSRTSTLAEAVQETRHYLIIEKIRFADKFSWTEHIGEHTSGAAIPRLAIQTLAENALIHGIEPSPESATLDISSSRDGDVLTVAVADSGVGIGAGRLAAINAVLERGEKPDTNAHIGLANLNLRIRLEHGSQYGVRLREREGGGIISVMTLPFRSLD
ncbi:MAG TPA: histidine kinase [Treponemataceae bacterium]|nr:histidine kinase [Treponemataceae bacterium]